MFFCRHRNTTRVFTPRSKNGRSTGPSYVVCLGCSQRIEYDLANMKMLSVMQDQEPRRDWRPQEVEA